MSCDRLRRPASYAQPRSWSQSGLCVGGWMRLISLPLQHRPRRHHRAGGRRRGEGEASRFYGAGRGDRAHKQDGGSTASIASGSRRGDFGKRTAKVSSPEPHPRMILSVRRPFGREPSRSRRHATGRACQGGSSGRAAAGRSRNGTKARRRSRDRTARLVTSPRRTRTPRRTALVATLGRPIVAFETCGPRKRKSPPALCLLGLQ